MLRTLEREQALAGSDLSRISFFANHRQRLTGSRHDGSGTGGDAPR